MNAQKRRSDKAGRGPLGSLGRPPAVGVRRFRNAGRMPPSHPTSKPPSGRYLSFVEREEIALLRAQAHGVREIARQIGRSASTISRELRRNAATRSGTFTYRATTAQGRARASCPAPEASEAGPERGATTLRAGPSRRGPRGADRRAYPRAGGRLEGTPTRAAAAPANDLLLGKARSAHRRILRAGRIARRQRRACHAPEGGEVPLRKGVRVYAGQVSGDDYVGANRPGWVLVQGLLGLLTLRIVRGQAQPPQTSAAAPDPTTYGAAKRRHSWRTCRDNAPP